MSFTPKPPHHMVNGEEERSMEKRRGLWRRKGEVYGEVEIEVYEEEEWSMEKKTRGLWKTIDVYGEEERSMEKRRGLWR